MRRVISSALIVGVASLFSLAGCSDETKQKDVVSTPTGTTTTETTVKSSGSNPPANTAGETGAGAVVPK